MALPPFIILRETDGKQLMLGASRWTTLRNEALSFSDEGTAGDYLTDARKQTPRMFEDVNCGVARRPDDTNYGEPAPVAARSDYDPTEAA